MRCHIRVVLFEIKTMIYRIWNYLLKGISPLSRIPVAKNDCLQEQIAWHLILTFTMRMVSDYILETHRHIKFYSLTKLSHPSGILARACQWKIPSFIPARSTWHLWQTEWLRDMVFLRAYQFPVPLSMDQITGERGFSKIYIFLNFLTF